MFNLYHRKVNSKKIISAIGKGINVILLVSLILTSCKPVNTIKPQQTTEPTPLVAQATDVPQPTVEYEPPVFVQPEARIAENIDPLVGPAIITENSIEFPIDQFLEKQEEIKSESKAEFQAVQEEMAASIAKIKLEYQSFKIVPNPIRTIIPKIEPIAKWEDNSSNGDIAVVLPKAFGKRIGAPALQEQGNTYTVTNLTDLDDGVCDSDCSLREAIYAANDSIGADIIIFGVNGTINLENTLPYIQDSEGLTIDGSNQSITINGPTNTGQIFYIYVDVPLILKNINISGGFFYNEGKLNLQNVPGIFYIPGSGVIEVSDCNYVNQSSYFGGTVSITNCYFNNNPIFGEATVKSNASTFTNNSQIYSKGPFTGNNSHFSESRVYSINTIHIINSFIYDQNLYSEGDTILENTEFSYQGNGGFYSEGIISLIDCSFNSHGSSTIYSEKSLNIDNTSIMVGGEGESWYNGELHSEGITTITNSQIQYTGGGGIYSDTNITITNSKINSEKPGYIHSLGGFNSNDSTFTYSADGWVRSKLDSHIYNSNFNKARIQSPNTVYISGVTSIDNAGYLGEGVGDLIIENSSTLLASNSNISYCDEITNNGTLKSINNTFVHCGILNTSILNLQNSILANDSQCHGSVTNAKNNLLELTGGYACNIHNGENSNIVGSKANLKKYSDSILSYSSPAIDHGDPAICTAAPVNNTSQNGVTRPQGKTCDIGSYEAPPAQPVDDKTTASDCSKDDCIDASDATNNKTGKPINTRTGAYQYNVQDISIPTVAGPLTFSRDYSSMGIPIASTLSPGWTHNQDTRLIMPTDPEGEEGVILFKLHTSNLYTFTDNGDGTFTPAPGLLVALIRQDGPPVKYTITDNNQNDYVFDETGKLTNYKNAQGYTLDYSYNTTGLLSQITDNVSAKSLSFTYDTLDRIVKVVDQTGRNVNYTYDNNGDLIQVIDVLDQLWTYTYDSAHRMTNVLDPNGNSLERTEYDEQGRAVRQYDGENNLIVELTYNADGTTIITDALGHNSINTYDERGTLVSNTDATGNADEKSYLSNFRPFSITDADGNSTNLSWSEDGVNLTRIVDAQENQTDITYDELNNPTSVVNPLNYLTTYEYEGKMLTRLTDALNNERSYTYSPEGYLQSVTDPLGKTTTYTNNSQGQRTSMTDPSGNTWTYAYDEFGNQNSTIDPLGRMSYDTYDKAGRLVISVQNYDGTKPQNDDNLWNIVTSYQYDTRGNQIAVTDTYNRTTHYEYDAAGRLVKTIDPAGNETINTYNEAGQLVAVTDAMGHVTHYAYDESGRQISTTDPDGKVTQTVYNPDGTVASSIDALGNTTSYTYDSLNRVSSTTNPDGSTTTNTYDAAGNLIAVTDALGKSTQYEYNALGALIKTTDPLGGVTEKFYDDNGRLIQTRDALGNTTTNAYNDAGQLASQTDALGNVTNYEYDPVGRRIAVIDPDGNHMTYGYDSLDRLVTVTDPMGAVTRTEYDALGQVLSRTDALGNKTTYAYDSLGYLISQTDPLGNSTTFTYDNLGNQLTISDALGRQTSFTYDNNYRQTGSTNALSATISTAFDALGRVISKTDELGRIESNEYDSMGRVIKQTNAAGAVTLFNYDTNGNLLNSTDANNHSTTKIYDALGRVLSQTDPNGLTTTFTYDAAGNLLSQTDNAGNQARFIYDALNRQVQMIDPLGNTTISVYDSKGNLVQKTDAKGIVTKYEYDEMGNLTAVIENVNSNGVVDAQTNVRTEYLYDLNGNLLTIKDANGHISTTYTYNGNNQVLTESDALGQVTAYSYDAVGNRTQMVDANGVMVTYGYDAVNQLISVDYPGMDQDVQFAYDAAGQRTQLTDGVGSTTWTFNALGQPTAITDPYQKTVSYGYDAVGNKTTLTYADGKTVNYAYDAGNRLSTVTDWQSLVTQYTYNNKNLVSNVQLPNSVHTTYTYDAAGRVQSIVHANDQKEIGSYTYTYDAVGNRTHVIEKYLSGQEIIPSIAVTVKDTQGTLQPGTMVYAFHGATYTGFSAITDASGVAKFILPEGSYRFRTDKNGLQYFSSTDDHCTVIGCNSAEITVPIFTDVSISVLDSNSAAQAGLPVYAFTGSTYTGFNGITDEQGLVSLKLPEGSYHFRADKNKEQFFSSTTDACTTPECTSAAITVPQFDNVVITVTNSAGQAQADIPVYAFNGTTYTGYHAVTDGDGHAELLLREGSYRFRADLNGLQYFSANENNCTVIGCQAAAISVPVFGQVSISIANTLGTVQEGLPVYVFDGATYKGFSGTTDSSGQVTLTLPEGNYRFRTDLNSGQYFSSDENLCAIPTCVSTAITVPQYENVTITVSDTAGIPQVGLPVYAFNGSTYTGFNSTTDANGQVVLLLKEGSYRFRADLNGQQFFSADSNHCTVMGCSAASITLPAPQPTATPTSIPTATQTEAPTDFPTEVPSDIPTEAPSVTPTPSETPVGLNLNLGKALASMINPFRVGSHVLADQSGTTVTVSVTDTTGTILSGQTVYVFDGTTYKGISGISDSNGQVVFTLADGNYRFRTDRFNRQFFSGAANTCSTPTCTTDTIIVPVYGQVAITVKNSAGDIQSSLNVYAFNGTTYTGFSAVSGVDGVALFNLPEGSYRFRADTHGLQYFSGTSNHCSVPACTSAEVTVPVFGNVTVTVANTAGAPQTNLPVYVFNGTTYTGFSARTDAAGIATLTLPEGSYRFRTDLNGSQYFSNTANHCSVPSCSSAAITTPVYGSVTISVVDSASTALAGLPVYVFNGSTYTGWSGTSNASGQVTLNLPEGSYRFRSDLNGQQYFSSTSNHCTVPTCTNTQITSAVFGQVTVTVTDSAGTVQPNLPVYAFRDTTYTGFNGITDANGQVTLNLPQNNYRFRTDVHGAQYFSNAENNCAVPTCTTISVVTPVYGQVTITAQSGAGKGQADLPVYVFNETIYTGLSGVTGTDGKVTLWIPAGSYRFRADQFDLQFFSGETNHCTVPECTLATINSLGMQEAKVEQTIDYSYDPLNRLTNASYDDGTSYAYTYDAVGNRLTETKGETIDQYTYDEANRLIGVNGQVFTYDPNGNLLTDGLKIYAYNYANRLTNVTSGTDVYQYVYNGLGDRLQSILNGTATTYSLDLNSGLTQVLAEGTNTYTYGFNRIAQVVETQTGYFLGDALGSVRQVVDSQAEILLAQSYSPYGELLSSVGDFETAYSYTGEMTDGTGLVNLRARYYDPGTGRFVSRDTWGGDKSNPITMNKWVYANGNPIIYYDPSGLYFWGIGETLNNSSLNTAQTQNVHIRIQLLAMIGQINRIHAEYTIPGTNLPIDLLDSDTGEIWEIKPWADRYTAYSALDARLNALEYSRNRLKGINPIGKPYDWSLNPSYWIAGTTFTNAEFVGTDDTGLIQIWAGQVSPGVIAWWKFNSLIPLLVTSPIYLTDQMKYSNRNNRQEWNPPIGLPNLKPQPAFYSSQNLEIINQAITITVFTLIISLLGICSLSFIPAIPV